MISKLLIMVQDSIYRQPGLTTNECHFINIIYCLATLLTTLEIALLLVPNQSYQSIQSKTQRRFVLD
jgi:hypothetical protein